ncbi:MAG: PQQ-binding-like beta-propeller repeat protein, partial [Candidatus Acidiferrum sp.]
RGPSANGTSPHGDPPITWSANKNIKWKAELEGRGSSTPIVWRDQVFVLTAVPTERQAAASELPKADPQFKRLTKAPAIFYRFEVLSFDRATGKLRWRQTATEQVPHEGHHPTHSYAGGSPTTDGERLYVSFGSRGTYCYSLAGKPLWKRDLGRLNTRLGWGEAVTPVIHGDDLILNWDQEANSALICLDAGTGATRWKTPRDEASSWNTPLVVEVQKRGQVVFPENRKKSPTAFLVIVNGTNRARAYDLHDGKEVWECGGMTVNAIPSPVAADGVAYVMSGYKGSMAAAIPLDAAGDLTGKNKIIWRHSHGTPYVPSPLLANDRIWFTQANNALLTVLDAKSGKPLIDHERLPGMGNLYASPVAAGGRVYLVGRDGTTIVLKQSDKLEVLATNHLDDEIDASPAIAGRDLFLRGQKYLYCVSEK